MADLTHPFAGGIGEDRYSLGGFDSSGSVDSLGRTRGFGGGIGPNRYAFGGFEGAVATGVLSLSAAAVGLSGADPFTSSFAGLIGSYRTVQTVSAGAEAQGSAGLAFSASAYSNSVVDLTAPWGGFISRWRTVDSTPVTGWGYNSSGKLSGTIQPIAVTLIPESIATVNAALTYAVFVTRESVGSGGLTFTSPAAGKANFLAGATGSLTFSADGEITSVGTPLSLGAGEGNLAFSAVATGERTWPIQLTANLSFSAEGASASNASGVGEAGMSFFAGGFSPGDTVGVGSGGISFSMSAKALTWTPAASQSETWANSEQSSDEWTPVNTDTETWNG